VPCERAPVGGRFCPAGPPHFDSWGGTTGAAVEEATFLYAALQIRYLRPKYAHLGRKALFTWRGQTLACPLPRTPCRVSMWAAAAGGGGPCRSFALQSDQIVRNDQSKLFRCIKPPPRASEPPSQKPSHSCVLRASKSSAARLKDRGGMMNVKDADGHGAPAAFLRTDKRRGAKAPAGLQEAAPGEESHAKCVHT